jgi:hypothetical protein
MSVAGRRKPGLGMARHQEIGLELARIRDRLTALSAERATVHVYYPHPEARESR